MLACDGTHIGVSLRNMQLENPVTCPDDPNVIHKALHRRLDRTLLRDQHHRDHLRYLCSKMLGKLKPDHLLDPQTEGTRTNLLLQHVQTCLPNPAVQILVIFAQKTQDEEVLQCLARILYMLSGDAAVSSVVPFKCHDLLLSLVEDT